MIEAVIELTLWRNVLKISVFVTEITDDLIRGLDVLRVHDNSLDLGRHVILQGRENMSLF